MEVAGEKKTTINCPETTQKSSLNPNAKEWHPQLDRLPAQDRTLFFTFSNGLPISILEISRFFEQNFGLDAAERVYIHWPEPRMGPPLSGKVTFNRSLPVEMLLTGENDFKFNINGKPLWCKRYEPERNIPPRKRTTVAGGN